ncbi:hypothetical protein VKT23_008579 [Stygiomarasmius scandens]|uniref:2OGFeDO JBP1/TET oxygenase domain-containing protein n=1 Tax=Marasmiellus scandens TaxID=2682957 RepID=A0ABR1JHP8_9AGAR
MSFQKRQHQDSGSDGDSDVALSLKANRHKKRFVQVESESETDQTSESFQVTSQLESPNNIFAQKHILHGIESLRKSVWATDEGFQQNLKPVNGVDLQRLAKALRKAILHKVVLPIDAEDYFLMSRDHRHNYLANWRSQQRQPYFFSENTVFVDQKGNALVWYLPNLLSEQLKHRAFADTALIDKKLASGIQKVISEVSSNKGKKWRANPSWFVNTHHISHVRPGVANFSFGWRPSGKERTSVDIAPSLSLRGDSDECDESATRTWLKRIEALQLTVSLILSVIHPELFEAGRGVLAFCCAPESHKGSTHEWASQWNSVYTALTVICGRKSPAHVDSHGSVKYLDALVSLGTATKPRMTLQELGASFSYKAGTLMFFSGKAWTHEVLEWGKGERICYASYMRPEMIEAHGLSVDGWGACVI